MAKVATSRRPPRRELHGVLVLDKPAGLTSNAALQSVRRLLNAAKGGHTGSLDPMATGVLPLCFGEATRFSHLLLEADKTYLAEAVLGTATDSGDAMGQVIAEACVPQDWAVRLPSLCEELCTWTSQVPPMVSALKQDGKRLYELARAGKTVARAARPVTIHACTPVAQSEHGFTIRVRVSKGTYIRVLVEDMARALGTLGHLVSLRRESSGPFFLAQAHSLEALQAMCAEGGQPELLPMETATAAMPRLALNYPQALSLIQGQTVKLSAPSPEGMTSVWVCPGSHHPSDEAVFIGVAVAQAGHLKAQRLLSQQYLRSIELLGPL